MSVSFVFLAVLLLVVIVLGSALIYRAAGHHRPKLSARRAYDEPLLLGTSAEDRPALISPMSRSLMDIEITSYGEDLQMIGAHMPLGELSPDDLARYERALNAYDVAKNLLTAASTQHDLDRVTRVLDSGRDALRGFLPPAQ